MYLHFNARFIKFIPQAYSLQVVLRCDVNVDNVLQTTPSSQRSSSSNSGDSYIDSTLGARSGWIPKEASPSEPQKEHLTLDLKNKNKNITGIRVGTNANEMGPSIRVTNLALEFRN